VAGVAGPRHPGLEQLAASSLVQPGALRIEALVLGRDAGVAEHHAAALGQRGAWIGWLVLRGWAE